MRLCTCGHRDARHDQLIGGCLACSCGVFDDFRSSLEEEIPALTPGTAEHAEYVAEALALAEVDVAVLEPDDTPCVEPERYPLCGGHQVCPAHSLTGKGISPDPPAPNPSLPDLDLLERFEAWRCAVCGSRSWKQIRCEVLPKCRSRWLEPVTVEIRRREVPDGQ